MDKNKFGTYIREKRTEQGYTQKNLADLLMVDVTTVSKWERGVNYPDITMIPDICKYLEVNEHELIESSNDTQYREIAAQADKFNKIKNAVFYSFSGCYFLAVLICFIVTFAVEKRPERFFTAAAGALCGFTFVPSCLRFFRKYHLCIYLATTWASLTLLFLTCSILTGDYWFYVASSGVLLGYFVIFFPVLAARQKNYLAEEKYVKMKKYFCLIYFAGMLILSLLVLVCVNIYNRAYNFTEGLKIMLTFFSLPLLWGFIELLPIERLSKTELDFIITGIYFYLLNAVFGLLFGEDSVGSYCVDFGNWNDYVNGNILFIALIVFTVSGAVMLTASSVMKKRRKS